MTTIRRLVLELGVDDSQARDNLEKFNTQVDALKISLQGLEFQMGNIGSNLPSLSGFSSGVNVNDPLSQQERAYFDQQKRLMAQESAEERKLTRMQIESQNALIDEIKTTRESNVALIGDVTGDLKESKRNLLESKDIIKDLLPFAEARDRPLGRRGNMPSPFEKDSSGRIIGANQSFIDVMQPVWEPIERARRLIQQTESDPQTEQQIQEMVSAITSSIANVVDIEKLTLPEGKSIQELVTEAIISESAVGSAQLENLPDIFEGLFEEFQQTLPTEMFESPESALAPFGGIPESLKSVKETIGSVIEDELDSLEALQKEIESLYTPDYEPFTGEVTESLEELQTEINSLKRGYVISTPSKSDIINLPKHIPSAKETLEKLKQSDPSIDISMEAPETQLPRILQNIKGEREKERIKGFTGDIGGIFQEQMDFEEKIHNRGFVTGAEKLGLGLQRRGENIKEGIGLKAKDKLTEFMTKERSLFGKKFAFGEKAEDFIEKREMAREEAIKRAEKEFTINIYNPSVRNNQDIEEMKRQLKNAVLGL